MTFSASDKKKGDLLKSEDWNALTAEVQRLGKEKLDRNQDDTFKGSLTVEGALNIKPKGNAQKAELSITGSISVSQSLTVGDFLSIDSDKKSLTLAGVEIKKFTKSTNLQDDANSLPTESAVKGFINSNVEKLKSDFTSEIQNFQQNIDSKLNKKADLNGSRETNFQVKDISISNSISFDEKTNLTFYPGQNERLLLKIDDKTFRFYADGDIGTNGLYFFDNATTKRPMEWKYFRLNDNPNHDTGYASNIWIGTIVGINYWFDGEYKIAGVRMRIEEKNGNLYINGDVGGVIENWEVYVLFIRKNWVNVLS
ncbi:hypothetical protein [Nostoc sp. ChiQUE01b]|uniref:hypothetical protein n=1 Tax=Nostoc sp. ChiQUE01b TaxID=3075376 RepID=UPI002AD4FC54|nr:hypothetical protein [Nostoc sp. ChiQUE01b]MDZ8263318.1 hypothetical protein [Nostoc sp. ChiQUE01b]